MVKKLLIALLVIAVSPVMAKGEGKNKDSDLGDKIEDALEDVFDKDDKGKPNNPGKHGRDNAEDKRDDKHGKKGGKKDK